MNNNTQKLLDILGGAKTPEEMAALEASGTLQAARQEMGSQYDASAVRAAQDNRPEVSQARATQEMQFKNALRQNRFCYSTSSYASITNR